MTLKEIRHFNTVHPTDNWEFCVSAANSLLSTNWKEFFFADEEEARRCAKALTDAGYVVLVVSRDEY